VDKPSEEAPICESEVNSSISANNADGTVSKFEALEMVKARRSNRICVILAVFVLLFSLSTKYLFNQNFLFNFDG
jgi:hypothetical protein